MKKILIVMLMLVTATVAKSQITHTASGTEDKKASAILAEAAKKMNGPPVAFTVTMVNRDSQKKETARQTAQVLYSKGKYRVSFPSNILYSDGKSIWHWNQDVSEVVVQNVGETEDLMNPALLLSTYQKNFKAKYIRSEADGSSVIDLTPKKSRSYHKIRVIISKNSLPVRMEIHNYDATVGEFIVSGFKSGISCNDKDFVFDASAHKNVEIIDMR